LNSEEEHELEEYFKEIEEENRVVEEGKVFVTTLRGTELAAIPEASPKMSGARRGKRHASELDVDMALKAEKIKAIKSEGNLDSTPASVNFDTVSVIPNLEHLGIALGSDESSAPQALLELRKSFHTCSRGSVSIDKKGEVLDLEEKDLADEEEVDKLLLQSI
jgi:hypothetical protein